MQEKIGEFSRVMNMSVCSSVSLFVLSHNSKTTRITMGEFKAAQG